MAERRKQIKNGEVLHPNHESIGSEALEEASHIGTRSPDHHVKAHVFGLKI